MKKFTRVFVGLLIVGFVTIGCATTGSTAGSTADRPQLSGRWITSFGDAIGALDLRDSSNGWNGIFVVDDFSGNRLDEDTVALNTSGQITFGSDRGQYAVTDVTINGKYLGERMTISGIWRQDQAFHKVNPSKNIELGGTSWKLLGDATTIVFKDDGTFKIELSELVKLMNDRQWGADTEGTYVVDGTDVTMNYPNGSWIKFSRTSNGGVSFGNARTASQVVYIEGDTLVTDDSVSFALVTE